MKNITSEEQIVARTVGCNRFFFLKKESEKRLMKIYNLMTHDLTLY
jgi:hypothetical protein